MIHFMKILQKNIKYLIFLTDKHLREKYLVQKLQI